jgi:hypothetical protein
MELEKYVRGPACERLALGELLLNCMASDTKCDTRGYEWKPGTDDLSLPTGRTKWMLELVLGVKLPGIVDRNASPEYLKKLHEEARLAVEAYRQGIMALAADHEVPPQEFARLKRKYNGKIPGGPWAPESGLRPGDIGMNELLLEWPPVGRKYEDLVSIIGAKGHPEKNGVSYTFERGPLAYRYLFVLQAGVIRSMVLTVF